MSKQVCVSGILFDTKKEQLLLVKQTSSENSPWEMVCALVSEASPQAFTSIISSKLGCTISSKAIRDVYDYDDTHRKLSCYVYVSLIDSESLDIQPAEDISVGWFTFKQIGKLPIPAQIKHDCVIAERVIKSVIAPSPQRVQVV